MKRVFISYSIEDSNLHLITLLLEHLRKNNFNVSVSTQLGNIDARITQSDIFIGIITNNSSSINYVVEEWKIAKENNISDLLIVEDGVKIDDSSNIPYIRFNRTNPNEAIDKLFKNNKPATTTKKKKNNDEKTFPDVLKFVAVIACVAALIKLLSRDK